MSSRSILGFIVGAIIIILMIFACVALYRWINPPSTSTQPAASVLPSPTLVITPQPNIYKAVNEVIAYSYVVTNNGTTRLAGPVTVTDNKVANVQCPDLNSVGNKDGNLDVGESTTCTATYTITQADIDNTFMTDTATVSAGGLTSLPATATIRLNPVLSLTVTATPNSYSQAGQNITFTYTITNTGPATLGPAQFIVRDDHIPTPINCGANNTTLATNQSVSCNTVYTTTAADASANQIVSTAVASGASAGSVQQAVTTITKASGPPGPSTLPITPGAMVTHVVTPGDWLLQISRCYGSSLVAVQTANPQVRDPDLIYPNMIVRVPNVGSTGPIYGPPCMIYYVVQSGDTWTSIANKYNAALDIMAAANPGVTLKAGIKIKVPVNSNQTGTPYPVFTPIVTSLPPNTLLKLTVSTNPGSFTGAGQVINLSYTITNIGATNLGPAQFIVTDSLIPNIVCPANVTLAPNQATSCNTGYTTTQADVTAGKIVSSATASGAGASTPQPTVTTIPYNPPTTQPIRLTFPAGSPASLSRSETISTPGTIRYVFAGSANQTLNAQLLVSTNDVSMGIYGPDNTTLKAPDAVNTWSGTLPLNGDYYIDLTSSVGVPSKTFTLNLTLTTTAPPSNTVRVADINPGSTSSSPSYLSPFNGQLFFQANGNANTGEELWKYDPPSNAASLVADIFQGPPGSKPTSLRLYQNMLYFGADGGTSDGAGTELWRFNGSGVGRVNDIYSGSGSSYPMYMTEYNGELYFSANGNNGAGIELWKFTGSNSATTMAYDVNPGPGDSKPSYLTVYNNLLYFAATTTDGGTELWKFDGSKATLASDIVPGATNSSPAFLAVYNNLLYFSADGNNGAGNELWKFDGATPSMAFDVNPGPAGSAPTYLTVFNNALFFGAIGNNSGFELWKFDGAAASMAADINPGPSNSNPAYLAVYNNELYFQADGGDGTGAELWKYKGP